MDNLFSNYRQSMEKLTHNKNSIVFSSLSEFYEPVESYGFAIKYVVEGSELYVFDNHQNFVKEGSYLLCNSTKYGHVEIESRNKVKGICVNIDTDVMMDMVSSFIQPDTPFSDKSLARFFTTSDFLETQYNDEDTIVGRTLRSLSKKAQAGEISLEELNDDIFYFLAENIIKDNVPVFKQLQSLPFIKSKTRKDLYRRVNRAKDMMDAYFQQPVSIQEIAKEACLSEYHFFRLFKSVMKITPHQYILQKRLSLAKEILKDKNTNVSDTALYVGFTDVYSFSKSFKKKFGVAPSSFYKK